MNIIIKNKIILFSVIMALVFSIGNTKSNQISNEKNSNALNNNAEQLNIYNLEIKASGDNEYSRKLYFYAAFWQGLCTGDQDNDGKSEIILSTGSGDMINVFEYNATYHNYTKVYNKDFENSFKTLCSTDDLDKEGKKEIIGVDYHDPASLMVLEYDQGDNKYKSVLNKSLDLSYATDLCIGDDLDCDGNKEIIIGGTDHVQTYEYNGTQNGYKKTWESSQTTGNYFSEVCSVDDLDNDGDKEILASTGDKIYLFENKANDSYVGVWNKTDVSNSLEYICFGNDLDSDGKKEIIVGGYDNMVKTYEYNGTNDGYSLVWNSSTTIDDDVYSVCVGDDLDGDGKKEILAGSKNNKVYIFEYNGTDNGYSLVWNSGTLFKNYVSKLCIGDDLDKDGKKEIIAGLNGGWIHILQYDDTVSSPPTTINIVEEDDDDDEQEKEGIYVSTQNLLIGGAISAVVIAGIVIILIKKKSGSGR